MFRKPHPEQHRRKNIIRSAGANMFCLTTVIVVIFQASLQVFCQLSACSKNLLLTQNEKFLQYVREGKSFVPTWVSSVQLTS